MAIDSDREPGKVLQAQLFDPRFDLFVPFTQQEQTFARGGAPAAIGNPLADIEPTDANAARVRIYATAEELYTLVIGESDSMADTIDLDLPNVLNSVTYGYNFSEGSGTSDAPLAKQGTFFAVAGTLQLYPQSSAQASASILPTATWDIKPYSLWGRNVPCTRRTFFIIKGNNTEAQIRARATRFEVTGATVTMTQASPCVVTHTAHGYNNGQQVAFTTTGTLLSPLLVDKIYFVVNKATNTYQLSLTSGGSAIDSAGNQTGTITERAVLLQRPVFRPVPHQLTVLGQKVSIALSASTRITVSANASNGAQSGDQIEQNSSSQENGLESSVQEIPPTIHGMITPSGSAVMNKTATVTVTANTAGLVVILDGVETDYPPIVHGPITLSSNVSASISPSTLSATTPTTAIPTTGKYLWDIKEVDTFYGLSFVSVAIVDLSHFA